MKRSFLFSLTLMLIFVMAVPVMAAPQLDVNGRSYDASGKVTIQDGTTMAATDVLAHTLGCTVDLQGDAITMQENQDILKMTVGSNLALLNDKEKQMPRSAQRINGEVYVPARFIYESFGASVNWDDSRKIVSVSYLETRDNMAPEEMLTRTSQKITEAKRYKMSVDMNNDMNMSTPENDNKPQKMNMLTHIDGWVQSNPILMYIKQDATVKPADGAAQEEPQNIKTEMLLNDGGMYMTMPGSGWVKMNLPGLNMQELLKQSMNQDPTQVMKQMKDMGISVSFANDREKNGQKYWIIDAVMGGDVFKSDYFKQISKSAGIPETADTQNLLGKMDANISYSTWINQQTFNTDFMDLQGRILMNMDNPNKEKPGNVGIDMNMQASYTLSDFGVPFQVPDVSKAVDFDTIVQETK
ncbi:MAG: copper amine oxidase N-terminal domain-containing protein [Syntrophomonas sp.]